MEENKEHIVPGYQNVEEFSQKACKSMVGASRAFQMLPPSGSPLWDLRKSYPEFNRGLKVNRNRLITSMMSLMKHANMAPDDFKRRDVDEKFEFVVDTNDEILERIATSLDKAEGLFKRTEILVVNGDATATPPSVKSKRFRDDSVRTSPETSTNITPVASSGRKIKKAFYRNKVKEKPQLKFLTPVDNSLSPFVPQLRYKYHSLKPLSILPEYTIDNEEFYGHPYTVELSRWEPKPFMMDPAVPKFPKGLENTPFTLVETPEQLATMIRELGSVKEVAVDLEHHSYRSFLGFTCLMQISTRNADFVVDTLALREDLQDLNEVFTNPNILKIFHGAAMDITWLQKDFSVYVVGMFDTAVAAQLLSYSSTSLQYLLNHLCQTSTDKSFQLADWRIRPLPEEMVEYARKDTHYLLHIYDLLKNKLIEEDNAKASNLLYQAYDQSRTICLKRYEKPANNPQVALRKCKRPLNNRQLHGFIELFKWRDNMAREKDESLGFVLPNHMLLTISETLPKEMTGILACCDPVPVLVSQHLSFIHQIITAARDLPMHSQETSFQHKSDKKAKQKNWMIMMDSIHEVDLKENEANSENVLKKNCDNDWWKSIDYSDLKVKAAPKVLFDSGVSSSTQKKSNRFEDDARQKLSPFHRYKLTTEIIRNLKDAKKKEQVDLQNPLIQSVVQTILADPNEEKEEPTPTTPKPARKSTLLNEDFVPFNPMTVPKNKTKKRNQDVTDHKVLKKHKQSVGNPEDSDDNEQEIARLQDQKATGKVTKKQRINLLKRLASRGQKRRYELAQREKETMEDGEIIEDDTTADDTAGKSSKAKLTSYMSLGSPSNKVSPQKRNDTSPKGKSKKFSKHQKGKKKGGWNFRPSEGKSITFK